MKLLSLKGRNIGLLKGDFEFEFDDALTVITGPIGCGKSTVLTMIRASLTNSFPGNANSWASWGTPPQEACYFVVSWRIGNKVLHIAKAVAGEKKFGTLNIPRLRIEHDDGKVEEIFGSKEALDKTHSLIPVPASIIDGHLIVDQDSITTPVSATPAKFKEIIHTLTRTSELEVMRGQIKDLLLAITVPDINGPLQEAQVERNLAEGEVNRLNTEISELMAQYVAFDIQSINVKLDVLEQLKKNDDKRNQLDQRIKTSKSILLQLKVTLKAQQDTLSSLLQKRESSKEEAEQAKKNLYSADMLIAANVRIDLLKTKASKLAEELQKCISTRPVEPKEKQPAEGADTKIQDDLNEKKQQHYMAAKRLNLVDQGKCPECGTETAICAHDRAALSIEVQQLASEVELLVETLKYVKALNKEWDTYETDQASYISFTSTTMAQATEVNKALEDLVATTPKMTADMKKAFAKTVSDFDMLERGVSTIKENICAVNGQIQSQISLEESLTNELAGIHPARYDEHEYARLTKLHQDAVTVKDKVTRLDGSLDNAKISLDRAEHKLDLQEKRAASVKPIEKFRKILDKVNEVLMKDGLPRLLSLQYMKLLNDRLRFYLSTINADFTAHIDDNLEFMATKSDGLVHHAKRLSGGQKQQASVCYLLAVNDVFASTLGVLALDEPSGAMQESNSRDLAEAFNYLAKIGRQTGRQFIVITHSPALAAYGCKNIALDGSERM